MKDATTLVDELKDRVQDLYRENEQLKDELERQNKGIEALIFMSNKTKEENKKLNNIIKELEKWLVEWREMLDCPDFYEEGIIDCINDTLIKLQELKGEDKE